MIGTAVRCHDGQNSYHRVEFERFVPHTGRQFFRFFFFLQGGEMTQQSGDCCNNSLWCYEARRTSSTAPTEAVGVGGAGGASNMIPYLPGMLGDS